MPNTTCTLIAASLFLAVAAAVPAAGAEPSVVCVQGACQEVDADALLPGIMGCDPILGCYTIDPAVPVVVAEVSASCSVSGDGDGIRAECHGN